MDSPLSDILKGNGKNHLLPFIWMHSNVGEDGVRDLVRAARQSGAREVCVESRPHEHFCEDEWWRDMDALLDEAVKLNMRVWILDDKHFPTGYANGLIEKKYPERRKWQLAEWSVDVTGPMNDASILSFSLKSEFEERFLSIRACRLTDDGKMSPESVDVSDCVHDGYFYWNIPEGVWRVTFLIQTRRGTQQKNYIHLIDRESAGTQIEAVYEPHYQRYKHLFGTTIAGFFSDEPSMGNSMTEWIRTPRPNMYDYNIGTWGMSLPWTKEILSRMSEELKQDALPLLPLLWYEGEGFEDVRVAYMNAVTFAWRDAFSMQLGDWCRARGVQYIGHIIEDMNAHAHLSCSAGHYFRSLEGQDMSGIDVVLHQIMPGMSGNTHNYPCDGASDPAFFDYMLGKLGASAAHLEARKGGRAMCEIFGAYGWAEGVPFMKRLMDHMLVRGINRFVPHAFSPSYPDPDCPPHFYGGGDNPQFPGFAKLMEYTNFVASVLEGGTHIASAAILYNAEAEWSCRRHERTQVPAKALYDEQLDYDIVPVDLLKDASVTDGVLEINGVRFPALVAPGTEYLPENVLRALSDLEQKGLKLYFTDYKPENAPGTVVPLSALPSLLPRDVQVSPAFPMLRAYHAVDGKKDVFMFVNESAGKTFAGEIRVSVKGEYAFLQKQTDFFRSGKTENGVIPLKLSPYESVVIVFGSREGLPEREEWVALPEIRAKWTVSRANRLSLSGIRPDPFADPAKAQSEAAVFEPVCETETLFNMTGFNLPGDPHFSGIFRYEADLPLSGADALDLGTVGQTARLLLNGDDLGVRMCPPYRFDLRGKVREGLNRVVIEVGNTLVHAFPDGLSEYMQIPPSGLLGPVCPMKKA